MVEGPLQVDGERLVRLLVEAEVVNETRLLPARIIVVVRCPMESQDHVVVRVAPFGSVDYAPLEGCVNVGYSTVNRRRVAFATTSAFAAARAFSVALIDLR